MKARWILTIFLIATALCLFSCKEKAQTNREPIFLPGEEYALTIVAERVKTKGTARFDSEGALHFVHEDPLSPLFGMEEVFTDRGTKSYFHQLSYEGLVLNGGTRELYRILSLIQNENPVKTEKKDGGFVKEYRKDGLAVFAEWMQGESMPKSAEGMSELGCFEIIFHGKA